eukprot:CAMPEP_0206245214 /NCGR_PEP_ID=MMETSP0047_2-20121206/18575_1 /ASSEMBLY_ACC=CAM_ASM_000192 /TAXON_ID=195065 /ORGANISM="Chroomonas mesostigmatica_cf, Strain CCMP1168" /LENGTH=590 /DNA_ID=CAMNT_0053670493 /DNA_START=23 /DNA_END=1795 /DNA_ORIENTATION=+
MSYYPQNTPPVKPHVPLPPPLPQAQTQLVYVTQQPQPVQQVQKVVLIPAQQIQTTQIIQQTPPPQQYYQVHQPEPVYQEPSYDPPPPPEPVYIESPPPDPVIVEKIVYVDRAMEKGPPAGNWQNEHKAWKTAKACYLCALLTAILCCLGLALIWPTILVARNIFRLDHTTYLQRVRFLNDNITYYQEANLNDARLCASRSGERKWGDRLVENDRLLENTFTSLRDQKDDFDTLYSDRNIRSAYDEVQRAEQTAAAVCGARTAPTGTGSTTIGSSRYQTLRDNIRSGIAADSIDTDKMFWEQETELVDQNWNLWLAIYISVGVCGTALAFLAAAYANLTAQAHKCWDAGAWGNNPNTTKIGAQQKLCVFFVFFLFTCAAVVCFSLENSGARIIDQNQAVYEYGHQLNSIRLYDEQLSASARLCSSSLAGLGYKERYQMAAKGLDESLAYFEILLNRLTKDYGHDGQRWDDNMRLLNNIKAANTNLISWEEAAIQQCTVGGGTSADRDRLFSTEYEDEKTRVTDSLRRLDFNVKKALDDNNGEFSNALRHGYRGATIALTVLWALVALAFFFYMAKLVNQRWASKMPGGLVI